MTPGNLSTSAWTSNPGFLEARDKALSSFWFGVKGPQISLWHVCRGFLYDRSWNSNSTAVCGYTGQKKWRRPGWIHQDLLTQKQQGSNDKTASPVSTGLVSFLPSSLLTILVMLRAQYTQHTGFYQGSTWENDSPTVSEQGPSHGPVHEAPGLGGDNMPRPIYCFHLV